VLHSAKALSGDLDKIAAHALKKEAHERYLSVDQFGADIERYLQQEPISLRSSVFSYRARKFVQRYKLPVALAAALFMGLIGSSVVLWQQQQRVEQERDTARAEQARAEGVSVFLLHAFSAADPSQNRGEKVSAREVLDQAALQLQEPSLDANTRISLGNALARTYQSLGLNDQAMTLLTPSADLPQARPLTQAEFWQVRAEVQQIRTETEGRLVSIKNAGKLLKGEPPTAPLQIAQRQLEIEWVHDQGKIVEALSLAKQLDADAVKRYGLDHPLTLKTALVLLAQMNAFERDQEVLTLINSRLGLQDLDTLNPEHLKLLRARAYLQLDVGRLDDAKLDIDHFSQSTVRLYGKAHRMYVSALNLEANWLAQKGLLDASVKKQSEVSQLIETLSGRQSSDFAKALNNMASRSFQAHDLKNALIYIDEALRVASLSWPNGHPMIANFRQNRAEYLYHLNRKDEAQSVLIEVLKMYELPSKAHAANAQIADAHLTLARIHLDKGNPDQARTQIKLAEVLLPPDEAHSVEFRRAQKNLLHLKNDIAKILLGETRK
jgi:eukaryotic-like serine/threonine-protein kinase